jgi:hypothetical protein
MFFKDFLFVIAERASGFFLGESTIFCTQNGHSPGLFLEDLKIAVKIEV